MGDFLWWERNQDSRGTHQCRRPCPRIYRVGFFFLPLTHPPPWLTHHNKLHVHPVIIFLLLLLLLLLIFFLHSSKLCSVHSFSRRHVSQAWAYTKHLSVRTIYFYFFFAHPHPQAHTHTHNRNAQKYYLKTKKQNKMINWEAHWDKKTDLWTRYTYTTRVGERNNNNKKKKPFASFHAVPWSDQSEEWRTLFFLSKKDNATKESQAEGEFKL